MYVIFIDPKKINTNSTFSFDEITELEDLKTIDEIKFTPYGCDGINTLMIRICFPICISEFPYI